VAIKFERSYELRVQREDATFRVIKNPLTVKFNIQRNNLLSVNSAQFDIINLNPTSRKEIRRDEWNLKYDKRVLFMAGYQDNMSICFNGMVQQAYSVREGVDFVTHIEGFDNPIAVKQTPFSKEYRKGQTYQTLMNDIVGALAINGVKRGAISNRYFIPSKNISTTLDQLAFQKDVTISGYALDIARAYFGPKAYVDNSTINYLNEDEYSRASLEVISSDTGLLGTPRQSNQTVYVDILFQPGLSCGQKITLDSIEGLEYEKTDNRPLPRNPNFNGDYRIMGITHKGVISDAIGGEAVTTLALLKFVNRPLEVKVGE
jgi:hypothetical protein